MKTYKLTIDDKQVTLFNGEYQDWSGETWGIDMHHFINFSVSKLTVESIVKALNVCVGLQLETGDLFFENGKQGAFTIVENEDGMQDKEGKFLADYAFTVEPTSEPLNLEKLFNQ